jgi:hypothetical protein
LLSGCGGGGGTTSAPVTARKAARPQAPTPPISRFLGYNYRAVGLYREQLTPGDVPDAIVTSVGQPTGEHNFIPANLQVLSWDSIARRWSETFNAQTTLAPIDYGDPANSNTGLVPFYAQDSPPEMIMNPQDDVTLGPVRFAKLLHGSRRQLIFSDQYTAGATGIPTSRLTVVNFDASGIGSVVHSWDGEGLKWQVGGNKIFATSLYLTPTDALCCPARNYHFVLGPTAPAGDLEELSDDRPFLGVMVRDVSAPGTGEGSSVQVMQIADNSVARGLLRVGDVIVGVENARPPAHSEADPVAENSLFDKLVSLNAGQTADLLVRRDGVPMHVEVKLGSMDSILGSELILPTNDYSVHAL